MNPPNEEGSRIENPGKPAFNSYRDPNLSKNPIFVTIGTQINIFSSQSMNSQHSSAFFNSQHLSNNFKSQHSNR